MDWLSANSSAVIAAASALFAAIIASTTTIVSIYFNNNFNKTLRQEQISFDKWKANRDFYLTKGEELFTAFNKWHSSNHEFHLLHILHLLDVKTSNDVRVASEQLSLKELRSKVNALTSIFFHELADDFKELENKCGRMTVAYAQAISGDETKSNSIILIQQELEFLRIGCIELEAKIAGELKAHL
jgi:hypothetical protein